MEKEEILILGAGGHAKSVADAIEQRGHYRIAGFIDKDEKAGKIYRGYRIIGTDEKLAYFFHHGVKNAAIGIGYLGNGNIREKLYQKLKEIGFFLPVIIDPSACLAYGRRIGEGTFIGKKAVVNADAEIGKLAIINSGAVIEHDCRIGNGTHIAVGAVVAGGASIGEHCLIGANAVVLQEKKIGDDVCVGAGAVVLSDVPGHRTVYGIVKEKGK